jgi:surface protein
MKLKYILLIQMTSAWIKNSETYEKICWTNIISGKTKCKFLTYVDGTNLPKGWERWSSNNSFYYRYIDSTGKIYKPTWKPPHKNVDFSPRLLDMPEDVMIEIIKQLFNSYPIESPNSVSSLMRVFAENEHLEIIKGAFTIGRNHIFNLVDTETWIRMIISMGFDVSIGKFLIVKPGFWSQKDIDYQKDFVNECRYTCRAHDLLDLKKKPSMKKVSTALLNKLISADQTIEGKNFLTGILVPRKFTYEAELESAIEELPHQNASVEMRFWDIRLIDHTNNLLNGLEGFVDLRYWDTSKITHMCGMFSQCIALITGLENWNTSRVFSMSNMFAENHRFNIDISRWDTKNCNIMTRMFYDTRNFNQYLPWDTSSLKNASFMFNAAINFNNGAPKGQFPPRPPRANAISRQPPQTQVTQIRPLKWDTQNVEDMTSMFLGADSFNQPLPWNTNKCRIMKSVFSHSILFNQPLPWDTSACIDMSNMFEHAHIFNQPLLWETNFVENMSSMFSCAYAFNSDISKWNTSSVFNMDRMFYSASSFNINISNWDTSKVESMVYMFYEARNFNQILKWNTSSVDYINIRSIFGRSHGSFALQDSSD